MKKHILLMFALLGLGTITCKAQYADLLDFAGNSSPLGANPYGGLVLYGDTLYGMAYKGGQAHDSGLIYRINKDGTGYHVLHEFNGALGAFPNGELTFSVTKDTVFGMTAQGGTDDVGVIFRMNRNGSGYTVLYNFSNQAHPWGDLTPSITGDTLFGYAQYGTLNGVGHGYIFCIKTDGTGYTDLLDFNGRNGGYPETSLTLSHSGNVLYGITGGGLDTAGIIFSVKTDGTGYQDLFDFNHINGEEPVCTLSLSVTGDSLFGTTQYGGAHGDGNIFSIKTDGSAFNDLFDFNETDGQYPNGSLLLNGHTLYGVTRNGGENSGGIGVVYTIKTDGTGFRDFIEFGFFGANGAFPYAGVCGSGHTLYGTTEQGGGNNSLGNIYSYTDTSIHITTGVSSFNSAGLAHLTVYPNPSSGIFTIQMTNIQQGMLNIQVYNTLGQQIYSSLSGGNYQLSVDLSNQPSGAYFYRITSQSGNLVGQGKLVIQK